MYYGSRPDSASRMIGGTACAILLAACGASTSVTSQWREPKATGIPFVHVLVVGISPDSRARRGFEQELSRLVNARGSRASASIVAGQATAPLTPESVAEMARSTGADAILITRIVNRKVALEEEEARVRVKTQQPGSLSGGPGLVELFSLSYNEYEEPGELSAKSTAVLESSLYEAGNGGRLVYSLTTTARFTEDRDDVIAAVASAIAGQLRRDGLIH